MRALAGVTAISKAGASAIAMAYTSRDHVSTIINNMS